MWRLNWLGNRSLLIRQVRHQLLVARVPAGLGRRLKRLLHAAAKSDAGQPDDHECNRTHCHHSPPDPLRPKPPRPKSENPNTKTAATMPDVTSPRPSRTRKLLQECRSSRGRRWKNRPNPGRGSRAPFSMSPSRWSEQSAQHQPVPASISPSIEPKTLSEGLPRTALVAAAPGLSRECHGTARIVAHFRRTPRSKADHRFKATGKDNGNGVSHDKYRCRTGQKDRVKRPTLAKCRANCSTSAICRSEYRRSPRPRVTMVRQRIRLMRRQRSNGTKVLATPPDRFRIDLSTGKKGTRRPLFCCLSCNCCVASSLALNRGH